MERQKLISLIVALLLVILGLFAFFYTARRSNATPLPDVQKQQVQSCSSAELA